MNLIGILVLVALVCILLALLKVVAAGVLYVGLVLLVVAAFIAIASRSNY